MNEQLLRELLQAVQNGQVRVDDALTRLRSLPFEDLGFAKVDHHRAIRCGFPEVIYCEGKTTQQVCEIFKKCAAGGGNVLASRANTDIYQAIVAAFPSAEHNPTARTITLRQRDPVSYGGAVAIVTAGTSDIPVAEEARVTAEIMDQPVKTYHDVGVAGLHRLLAQSEALQAASVIIVVAGMEGALAGVVCGLVDCPVIAVPTSVGYGVSFHGLSALLAMLASCSAGLTVVSIDNGFAAGYAAARINRRINQRTT